MITLYEPTDCPFCWKERLALSELGLDYLDARYEPGSLLPRDPGQQAWVLSLHAYSDKCNGPALRDLVFEKRSKFPGEWDQSVISSSEAAWRKPMAWPSVPTILYFMNGIGQLNGAPHGMPPTRDPSRRRTRS